MLLAEEGQTQKRPMAALYRSSLSAHGLSCLKFILSPSIPQNGSESEIAQCCPTLSDPVDCSLPGSSVHGILQARILEWVDVRGSTLAEAAHPSQAP